MYRHMCRLCIDVSLHTCLHVCRYLSILMAFRISIHMPAHMSTIISIPRVYRHSITHRDIRQCLRLPTRTHCGLPKTRPAKWSPRHTRRVCPLRTRVWLACTQARTHARTRAHACTQVGRWCWRRRRTRCTTSCSSRYTAYRHACRHVCRHVYIRVCACVQAAGGR